jgi:dTDP-4-dehydrorhamnose 3,5-epimerase-like enzyme
MMRSFDTSVEDCHVCSGRLFQQGLCRDEEGLKSNPAPFKNRRLFYIYNVDCSSQRGEHAHKLSWEAIFVVKGSFRLTLSDARASRVFQLNSETGGIVVPPGIWCTLNAFEQDTICLVAASHPYAKEDYILDWQEFKLYKGIL